MYGARCVRPRAAAGWVAALLMLLVLLRGPQTQQASSGHHHSIMYTSSNESMNTESTPPPRVILTKELYVPGHRVAHPELCPQLGAGLALLVLVTSAPENSSARYAVRHTWGSFARRSDIVLAFVIGQSPRKYHKRLAREDALYGDMIQGNCVDSYSNLTLKVLSMLEWADTYCPRAPRLLKTDDDVFPNLPRLLRFLAAPQRANATHTVWGQYPSALLPMFFSGTGYVMTADCVRPMLRAAGDRPYIRLEDVFITGVLASALGFNRPRTKEFTGASQSSGKPPCVVQRNFILHKVWPHQQYELWRQLHAAADKCT
ncbi:beta-1,3-galactosyltransferase 4-like isoform X2 [Pectinophora gossypiella]|uniref:beta-1,3-galactosyltransferase 4-like isoform X2 n=1 Tax=Pectinophora gossypiella TaxID=13191 RepID=UPI00214F3CEF|nr:beta-1,3-galactosyltransferase 4-like isoform X2 [Pectinophora gossypiella]